MVAVRKDYVAPTELLIYTRTFLQRCRADGAGDRWDCAEGATEISLGLERSDYPRKSSHKIILPLRAIHRSRERECSVNLKVSCSADPRAGRGGPVAWPVPRHACGWKTVSCAPRPAPGSTPPPNISATAGPSGQSPAAPRKCQTGSCAAQSPRSGAAFCGWAAPVFSAASRDAPPPPPEPPPDRRMTCPKKRRKKSARPVPRAEKTRACGATAGQSG